jgi:hypothetical protein
MKARHSIALVILVLATGVLIVSCGFLGTSIDTRISTFVDSLNNDKTLTYKNLVPGSAIALANTGVSTLWDIYFPSSEGPFTYTMVSQAPYTASDVELSITFGGTSITKQYKLVMQNSGSYIEDWYISNIFISIGGVWVSLLGI